MIHEIYHASANIAATLSSPSTFDISGWPAVVSGVAGLIIAVFALAYARTQAQQSKRQADITEDTLELQNSQFELYKKQLQDETERERRVLLLTHYKDLGDNALKNWLGYGKETTTSEFAPFNKANANTYLMTAILLGMRERKKGEEHWYEWAFDHIKTGYPELYLKFTELRALETEHNGRVSLFIQNSEKEVNQMLGEVKGLSPQKAQNPLETNYYNKEFVLKAVQSFELKSPPTIIRDGEKSYRLVILEQTYHDLGRSDTESTLLDLKKKVDDITEAHRDEVKIYQAELEKDRTILGEIILTTQEILFDLNNLGRFAGGCDFELSLGTR